MKILVIGNQGYIGPSVCRQLSRSYPEANIEGFDTGYFKDLLTGVGLSSEEGISTQHAGDVRRFPVELLKECDAVVYLAAISNNSMSCEFESVAMDVNCEACVKIAESAKQYGVKNFTLASSCSIYSAADEGLRTELMPVNPLTVYARSKLKAEEKLCPMAGEDFLINCLRFATACGFSPRLRLDLVLNDFVASAIATGQIEILSDGTPWRPLIHIEDMARSIDWAVTRPVAAGGDFLIANVGSNEWNYRVLEIANAVQSELGGVELFINKESVPDENSYQVDFSYFAELAPKHVPRITLHGAVADLCEGLQTMNFYDANFRESELIRLKMLQKHRAVGNLNSQLQWC
jgi:nucleoside-diphosphate-sugar epimerase